MADPVLGSSVPVGVPSTGDSMFALDGGDTKRFTVEDLALYISTAIGGSDQIDGGQATDALIGEIDGGGADG